MREDAGEFVILKHSYPIEAARGDRGDRGGNFSLDFQPAFRPEAGFPWIPAPPRSFQGSFGRVQTPNRAVLICRSEPVTLSLGCFKKDYAFIEYLKKFSLNLCKTEYFLVFWWQ